MGYPSTDVAGTTTSEARARGSTGLDSMKIASSTSVIPVALTVVLESASSFELETSWVPVSDQTGRLESAQAGIGTIAARTTEDSEYE